MGLGFKPRKPRKHAIHVPESRRKCHILVVAWDRCRDEDRGRLDAGNAAAKHKMVRRLSDAACVRHHSCCPSVAHRAVRRGRKIQTRVLRTRKANQSDSICRRSRRINARSTIRNLRQARHGEKDRRAFRRRRVIGQGRQLWPGGLPKRPARLADGCGAAVSVITCDKRNPLKIWDQWGEPKVLILQFSGPKDSLVTSNASLTTLGPVLISRDMFQDAEALAPQ
jgi:hypothetical protein